MPLPGPSACPCPLLRLPLRPPAHPPCRPSSPSSRSPPSAPAPSPPRPPCRRGAPGQRAGARCALPSPCPQDMCRQEDRAPRLLAEDALGQAGAQRDADGGGDPRAGMCPARSRGAGDTFVPLGEAVPWSASYITALPASPLHQPGAGEGGGDVPLRCPSGPGSIRGQVLEDIAGREEAAPGQALCPAVVVACSGREPRLPLPAAGGRVQGLGSILLWRASALREG